MDVLGTAEHGYEPVRTAFAQNFARRGDRGAAVALYRHGRKVVDLWAGTAAVDGAGGTDGVGGAGGTGGAGGADAAIGGAGGTDGVDGAGGTDGVGGAGGTGGAGGADAAIGGAGGAGGTDGGGAGGAGGADAVIGGADAAIGAAWAEDTAQIVRSATKGVAAACLLLLHQRGQLDLDSPVGAYWPEFKARGKDRVTVRDVLAHRAGVPALDQPLTPQQALDGVSGPRAVAAQAPLFPPGGAHGYHVQTFSWLLGELVLRASGRTIGRFVAEEIARPLGLDLWIGLPPGQAHRVGRVGAVETPPPAVSGGLRARPKQSVQDAYADPGSLTSRAFGAIAPLPDENGAAYRTGELAASNGVATARSLARFYAALIGEVSGGPRLFVPATLTAARTAESDGPDRVLVVNTRFGLGYMLHGPSSPLLGPGSFGHPGRGGSLGFADPAAGIGFGYVTNGLQRNVTADPRAQALVRAVRECLR